MSARTARTPAEAEAPDAGGGIGAPVLDADPYWLMVSSAPLPLYEVAESGSIVRCNPAFADLAGEPRNDAAPRLDHLLGNETWQAFLSRAVVTGQVREMEGALTRADGVTLPVELAATAVRLPSGDVRLIGTLRDLTSQRATEERLRQEAARDALTGLPHRGALIEALEQHLALLRREPERPFALGFLDLDDFKAINDTAGHLVGDRVLVAVARRLQNGLRPDDRIFRYGGDEFVLLFGRVDGQDAASAVGRRVLHLLARPFRIGDRALDVSASLGICVSDEPDIGPEELIRRADVAMTMAKRGEGTGEAQVVAC